MRLVKFEYMDNGVWKLHSQTPETSLPAAIEKYCDDYNSLVQKNKDNLKFNWRATITEQ